MPDVITPSPLPPFLEFSSTYHIDLLSQFSRASVSALPQTTVTSLHPLVSNIYLTSMVQPEGRVDLPAVSETKPCKPTLFSHLTYQIEDAVDDINWSHVTFKTCAYIYLVFNTWLVWKLLPINGHWHRNGGSDRVPVTYHDFDK